MKEEIILSSFQPSDIPALSNIIRETWQYDQLCHFKTANKLARVYLMSCLTNQTYTQVACLNNQPIGIIMGKNIKKHHCPLRLKWQQFLALVSLYLSKEGRQVIKIFGNVDTIDQQLLKESQKDYQGEISFFAVNQEYRGLGIGQKLFQSLVDYMRTEKIQQFYLYTDTSCHYQFYEYQGMIRRCSQKDSFQIHGYQSEMTFFLYDYDLK